MSSRQPVYVEIDPFDLPEWLGTAPVTWASERGLDVGARIAGALSAEGEEPLRCDLLGVDEAFPSPVAPDELRVRAHQVWRHGEVLVLSEDLPTAPVLVLAVPGSRHSAEGALETLARLARAVGAHPEDYAVRLQVGVDQRRG